MSNYRVPAKGSRRFGGINFGLFKIAQKTFEESYAQSYERALLEARTLEVSAASFDINAICKVPLNSKTVPSVFAAAAVGHLARGSKLNELEAFADADKFAGLALSILTSFGSKTELKRAYTYMDNLLQSYKNARDGQERELEAAKIAGFLQGLSENLIVAKSGKFNHADMEIVYAKLIAEQSLLNAGLLPAEFEKEIPLEKILKNMEKILDESTLAQAASELIPVLKNVLVLSAKGNLTFDFDSFDELADDSQKSGKAAAVYLAVTDIMLDVFIDKTLSKDALRKSVAVSSLDAVRGILSAA
ncbi:MAG: hypothetical protein LBQ47_04130, partial [Endomicrobium sp.]|jgi:hypothetical protein|nr:hypothetical protein [Endomicrobium sp.]